MIGRVLICDGCGVASYPATTVALCRTEAYNRGIRRVRLGRRLGVKGSRAIVSREFCGACRGRGKDREAVLLLRAVDHDRFGPEARYLGGAHL